MASAIDLDTIATGAEHRDRTSYRLAIGLQLERPGERTAGRPCARGIVAVLPRACLEPQHGGNAERGSIGGWRGDLGKVLRNELCRRLAGDELGMAQGIDEKGAIGAGAERNGLLERLHQPPPRLLPRGAHGDDLGEHRIIVGTDGLARVEAMIDAHVQAAGRAPHGELARLRQEAPVRRLGVEPRLDGMSSH